MGRLEGEVALITGGGSGLGLALVDRFVEEGARVVVLERSASKVDALADRHGGEVQGVLGDVRSYADNARAVAACLSRFGKLDCAIGNAGIWDYSTPLDALAAEQIDAAFDEMFQVNVKGYLHLAKAAIAALARSNGSLIYTVSNAGFDPSGGGALYTASKHAVVGLIRQLAYEFAPAIRVNGVAPGPIHSDLRGPSALGLEAKPISDVNLAEEATPHLPLGLMPSADDYAGAYVMLASRRDSRAATGGVVKLDVGIAVRGIERPAGGGRLVRKYCGVPD